MPIGSDFQEVLSAAADGAEWAWTQLYRDLAGSLLAFLRSQGATDPDDLTAECFVHMVRGLPGFVGTEADFRAWAFTIARSRLVDSWRFHGRRPSVPVADPGDLPGVALSAAADQQLLGRASVEEVLAGLNADQRMVLVLRVVHSFSLRETAQIMDRSEGAVKVLQHRALSNLRRRFSGDSVPLQLVPDRPDQLS